jgi:hypothetical protein
MTDTHPGDRAADTEEAIHYHFDHHEIDWHDGTVWLISWLDDCGGYCAQRFYDDDLVDEDPASVTRPCPGPEDGVFATLDAVEAAMGEPLPALIYEALEGMNRPVADTDRDAWGRSFAFQIHHLLPDGTIATTWAPPWAENPLDPGCDLHG